MKVGEGGWVEVSWGGITTSFLGGGEDEEAGTQEDTMKLIKE